MTSRSTSSKMEAYYASIRDLISLNSDVMENGCWLWRGRGWGSDYQRIRYKKPDNSSDRFYVHRLAYFGYNMTMEVPHGLEISHLCGHRACVNPAHLIAETGQTNRSRRRCHRDKYCYDHHPPCLWDM